ncbi:MAG: hypothetical protein FE834_07625 [Gammaproteobacteria bacterium]|nr:hypothetical protein [Gammaproteobacteria bacterium]
MNIEQIKQRIGVFKIFLSISIVVFVSIAAWIFQNFSQVNWVQLIIAITAFFVVAQFIKLAVARINELIDNLGVE